MSNYKDEQKKQNREFEEKINTSKIEIGEIPGNTCPSIDKVIKDIESFVSEVEYLRKNAHKYETSEELGKDLPDFGWDNPTSDLDTELRSDNEKLRELGRFWYEEYKGIKSYLLTRDTALLEAVMKDVSDLPTEFPEYESDDRDAGAKAFKERVLSFLTP